MFRKKRYVLVCQNQREPGHPKGCCADRGSAALRERLKALAGERGLKGKARVLGTTCLDACEHGATVCVMPDNVWYGGVRAEDAEEIVEAHLGRGEPVRRLLIPEAPVGLALM
ncbi:MAG: (2Fe-2S) ferredoxin domain-containing protein [Nitrospinota bacterium]